MAAITSLNKSKSKPAECPACAGSAEGVHPDHSGVLNRLRRARGQLDGVERMVSERRYCVDILTQLRAAGSAMRSIEAEVLGTHLRACVKSAMAQKGGKTLDRKLDELMELLVRRGTP